MPIKGLTDYCTGRTKDGRPCQNAGTPERDGLCYTHYAKANGLKQPQEFRKKNLPPSTKILSLLGMDGRSMKRMRKLFPEIGDLELGEMDATTLLETVQKALALRAVADANPNTMRALVIISEHLDKDSSAPTEPEFVDLWSNA